MLGEKFKALIIISLLLPLSFCVEVSPINAYNGGKYVLREAKYATGEMGGIFSGMLHFIRESEDRSRIGDYFFVAGYDSARIPENAVSHYFAGIETGSGNTERYTEGAWKEINEAKRLYVEAFSECSLMSASCGKKLHEMIERIENGNGNAVDAASEALITLQRNMELLAYMGGDLSEYGGRPFEDYLEVSDSFQEPNGKYSRFRKAIRDYAFMDARGEVKVVVDWESVLSPGWMDVANPAFKPISIAARLLDALSSPVKKLPDQYAGAYNELVGANRNSAVREILRDNRRMVDGIRQMNEELDIEKGRSKELYSEVLERWGKIKEEGPLGTSHEKVKSVTGTANRDPSLVWNEISETKARVGKLVAESEATERRRLDNHVAQAILKRRSANSQMEHLLSSMDGYWLNLGENLLGLEKKCSELSKKSHGTGFEKSRIEMAVEKCLDARGARLYRESVALYLEGIAELRFMALESTVQQREASEEIRILEAMIEKAKRDGLSVSLEEQRLLAAKERLGPKGEAGPERMSEAHAIARAAQESIWDKARGTYGRLHEERWDANLLVERICEVSAASSGGECGGLGPKLAVMEGRYSGRIDFDSLGSLWDARSLYLEISGAGRKILGGGLLERSSSAVPAETPRCNEKTPISEEAVVWNPYSFEIAGFPPGGTTSLRTYLENALECTEQSEKTVWIHPTHEERVAEREIYPKIPLEMAIVEFVGKRVLAVETPGATITSWGIELEVHWPKEGRVYAEYSAVSSLEAYGPECVSDGSEVLCRYVFSYDCGAGESVNMMLGRPVGVRDEVKASSGKVVGQGAFGIIVEGADCGGHLTVDVSHSDLEESGRELLRMIELELGKLEGLEKEGYEREYLSLLSKSPVEVMSRGPRLLDRIEESLKKQSIEKLDELGSIARDREIGELKKWFHDREIPLPWLPSDPEREFDALRDAKQGALAGLSGEYALAVGNAEKSVESGRLAEKFGIRIASLEKLLAMLLNVKKADEYLQFSRGRAELARLTGEVEGNILRAAQSMHFPESGLDAARENLGLACESAHGQSQFIISEKDCEGMASDIDAVEKELELAKKSKTLEGLRELDSKGIYPGTLAESQKNVEKRVEKALRDAKNFVRVELEYAEEMGASRETLALAHEALESGRLNVAYAHAVAAKEEKSGMTGLVSMENSAFVIIPLILIGAVWQLRKKRRVETSVQKAIRASS